MDWFTLCLDGFAIASQGILHMAFLCRLTGREPRLRHFAAYLLALCGIQRLCVAAGWGAVPALAAELAVLYAMSRLALKNGRASSWTAAVLAVYIFQLSTGAVNSVEAMAAPWIGRGWPLYVLILLGALAASALCVLCCALVLRVLSLEEEAPYLGLLLLPGLFFLTAELYILETAYSRVSLDRGGAGEHLALLSMQLLGLAALLCTLYAYRRACRGFQAQAALASLTQSVHVQKTYVAEAQARYEKTRAFRHDLQNHLSVLDGLLGTGQAEEARRYLRKLEASAAALSPLCRTGDAAVDVVLGEKLAAAEARGVDTEASLRLPEGRAVDSFDLCVIFANALDNALRACRETEGPFLRVRGQRQGDFYRLEFENSCPPGPPPEAGTGLANIRAVAEKYGGAMRFWRLEGRFRLDVLLNISEHRGGSSEQMPCNPGRGR